MKKYILSMIIGAALAIGVFGQARDRVRISYIGFNCTSETEDNTLEMDGKGDEIFVLCNWIMADKNNNLEFNGKYRSPMQGDVNGHYGWVQAGSRSDKGGIRSGDQYRGNMTMGEFDISDGEVLTVTPTIWEWDGNSDALNAYQGVEAGHENEIKNVSSVLAKGMVQMADPIAGMQFMISQAAKGISAFAMAVNDIMGQAKDRPIGMDASGRFSPKSIVLTRDMMRKITQRNLGYGLGVIQIDYDEIKLGNNRDHGAYTLLIKLEYLGSTNTTGTVANNTGSVNNGVSSRTSIPPPSNGGVTQSGGATHASIPPPSNVSVTQSGEATHASIPPPSNGGATQSGGATHASIPPPSNGSVTQSGGATHASIPPPSNGGVTQSGGATHASIPPPSNGGVTQSGGAVHASIPAPSNGGAQMGNANGSMPLQTSTGAAQRGGYVTQLPSKSPASSGGALSLDGYWLGAFYNGADIRPQPFNFLFNKDGSLQYLGQHMEYKSKGNYLLSNNTKFQGRFDSPAGGGHYISFTGTLNGNQLSGTWGYDGNMANGGKWSTTKK